MSEEELEKLGLTKGELSTIIAKGLVNTFKDLANAKEGEIINTKEINKLLKEKDKEIERLNKENTILRQNSQYLVKQQDELEEVINKAIEYIEEYQEVLKDHNGDWLNYQDGFKPYLLAILKGVDKE